VELALDRRAFAYWDVELNDWVVASGEYAVQIGADAETVLIEQDLSLTGDTVVRELTMNSSVGDWFAHPLVGPALMAGLTESMTAEQAEQAEANPDGLRMIESMPMQQFLVFTNGAIPAEALEQLIGLSKTPAPVV
jgi:beta-glucosidase